MTERFLDLAVSDRIAALRRAATLLKRSPQHLEKDVWVVWALDTLFQSPIGEHLVFKGGTSLSKAYNAIRRFSEDVDVTYDIRTIAPDLVGDADDPIPPSRSQAKKWTDEVRKRLPAWLEETVAPLVREQLAREDLDAEVRREGDTVCLDYPATIAETDYIRPTILLEFGARSTGEPAEPRTISCDAAPILSEIEFPIATPRVMRAERTFWEKATSIHVYCHRGQFRGGDRYARHWYDLISLDDAGIATAALADRALAEAVASHKSQFFIEKDRNGETVDYQAAVSGKISLVPEGNALSELETDYGRMIEAQMLFHEPEPFDALMQRCSDLERRANA